MFIKIALAHLDCQKSDIKTNRELISKSLEKAMVAGAQLFVTPELALCGYYFNEDIGTSWIEVQPDDFAKSLAAKAAYNNTALMLCTAERLNEKLYNSCLVFDENGAFLGTHHKIAVQKGSEDWSCAGHTTMAYKIHGINFGVLICADAWRPHIAQSGRENGVEIFICPSAWPPQPCPPEECWQKRSAETNTTVLVCNRTGVEPKLDFRLGETLLAHCGKTLASVTSEQSCIFIFNWDHQNKKLLGGVERLPIE